MLLLHLYGFVSAAYTYTELGRKWKVGWCFSQLCTSCSAIQRWFQLNESSQLMLFFEQQKKSAMHRTCAWRMKCFYMLHIYPFSHFKVNYFQLHLRMPCDGVPFRAHMMQKSNIFFSNYVLHFYLRFRHVSLFFRVQIDFQWFLFQFQPLFRSYIRCAIITLGKYGMNN